MTFCDCECHVVSGFEWSLRPTNVGRQFLNIVKKNFPQNHKYHKICNSNNVKVSYSCMTNMGNIIKGHNMSILNPIRTQDKNVANCNCSNKELCPLNGQCLTEGIVYKGTIRDSTNGDEFKYIGLSERPFKTRHYTHKTSFKWEKYSTSTELSKKHWEIKNNGGTPNTTFEILKTVKTYEHGQKHCNLCLTEKLLIIQCKDKNLLNSRSEINAKCRHKRKFLLII